MYTPLKNDVAATELDRRQYIYGDDDGYYNSSWYEWGRWVLLAAIVVAFFLIFIVLSCFSARRRRKYGQRPYAGTGWLAPNPGPATYNGQLRPQQEWNSTYPPPAYNAYQPPPNQGCYGGQQNGYELSSPPDAYQSQRGGDAVYAPPSGPPPSKPKGDIIR